MSHDLISYAKSSAEWLRGMKWHVMCGSAVWVTNRANLAASELDNCVAEIERLRTALATAENDALERAAEVIDLQSANPHWGNMTRALKKETTNAE